MDSTRRTDQRRARSALRLLLRYPDVSRSVDQFKRISFHGADYIWNDRTENIIAVIHQASNETWVIRYRATSYYADILVAHSTWLRQSQPAAIALPSTTIGRWVRTIERKASAMGTIDRNQFVARLQLIRPQWRDGLSGNTNGTTILVEPPWAADRTGDQMGLDNISNLHGFRVILRDIEEES